MHPHTAPAPPAATAPQAATAALLLGAPLAPAALAGEFDLLAEGTPSTYILDDASILNKTTKKSVSDQLKALEVRGPGRRERSGWLAGRWRYWQWSRMPMQTGCNGLFGCKVEHLLVKRVSSSCCGEAKP